MKTSFPIIRYPLGTAATITALLMVASAAPPPPPVGFLWVERALTDNPDNGTVALIELTGFTFGDISLLNGPGAEANANFSSLGMSSISVPGAVGSGTTAGDLYFEIASNSISLDFAIGGSTNSGIAFPSTANFDVNVNLGGDFGAGSFGIASFNHNFSGSLDVNYVPAVTGTVSGIGLTDGSPISLDLGGALEINLSTGSGFGIGTATSDLTINGNVTLNQSYRTFELIADIGAIPEPSSGLLLLLGVTGLITVRRRN